MPVDFYDLVNPPTVDQAETSVLGLLAASGFPTTSWSPRSVPRRLIRSFSQLFVHGYTLIAVLAGGGYRRWSTGDWLDLHGEDFYGEPRKQAIATRGSFTFTDVGGGPHTIAAGALVVLSSSGRTYRNTQAGSVPLNGSAVFLMVDDIPGSAGNISSGDTLTLTTSFPGLTATNPGSWISTAGAERENDEQYDNRLGLQWGSIAAGMNDDFFKYWVSQVPEVGRVLVRQAYPLPGDVTVVIAGPSGPVTDRPELGAVTQTGSGPALTYEGDPFGEYRIRLEILTGGALGTATGRFTVDGGESFQASFTLPNPGFYLLPDTGLLVTLAAGTYVVGTRYEWIASRSTVRKAQDQLQPALGFNRVGGCIYAYVVAAKNVAIALAGTVTCTTGTTGQCEAEGKANITALQSEADSMGGTIYRAELIQRIMDATGARNVVLTSPASDFTLAADEIATFDTTGLSWV